MKIRLLFLCGFMVFAFGLSGFVLVGAQQSIVVVNSTQYYPSGQGLSPCTLATLYGPIVNNTATYATNTTTNLLGGYRVEIRLQDYVRYASISYVGTSANGQINFTLPCDRSLAFNNVTVTLYRQVPNSSFMTVGSTSVSLDEYTPAVFGQEGGVFAGTYFQRQQGADSYPSMVAVLPDGKLGPAEFVLNPNIFQAMILYTTGGEKVPNAGYIPTVQINGLSGLATVLYYGHPNPTSPDPSPWQQMNVQLDANAIIAARLATGQFLIVKIIANGKTIGQGYVRFRLAL